MCVHSQFTAKSTALKEPASLVKVRKKEVFFESSFIILLYNKLRKYPNHTNKELSMPRYLEITYKNSTPSGWVISIFTAEMVNGIGCHHDDVWNFMEDEKWLEDEEIAIYNYDTYMGRAKPESTAKGGNAWKEISEEEFRSRQPKQGVNMDKRIQEIENTIAFYGEFFSDFEEDFTDESGEFKSPEVKEFAKDIDLAYNKLCKGLTNLKGEKNGDQAKAG